MLKSLTLEEDKQSLSVERVSGYKTYTEKCRYRYVHVYLKKKKNLSPSVNVSDFNWTMNNGNNNDKYIFF